MSRQSLTSALCCRNGLNFAFRLLTVALSPLFDSAMLYGLHSATSATLELAFPEGLPRGLTAKKLAFAVLPRRKLTWT